MRLKRIEIFGFKSFGKKTVIDFTGPVTAIVGPNGSGKSNIVDAVRWVLGEQRVKSLRGNKMEDVIFSGSAGKRALGYAQVTVTLDNSDKIFKIDYDEIEITRRLFRSGESEYLLNKTKCRLMDIQNLLMDTGLSREGYSIISQGQIESIVSNSPQERKLLIEEAVGIVKYRTRRQEAEKKLEKATANLYRITDLISEIDSRLPNLKRQAQKAENFRVLSNELRDIEVGVFTFRMDMLTASLEKAKKDVEDIEYTQREVINQIASCEEEKARLTQSLEELAGKIKQQEEMADAVNGQLSAKNDLLVSLRSQKKIEEERIAVISSGLDELRENLASLEKRKKETELQIIAKTAEAERLKNIYDEKFALSEDARAFKEASSRELNDTQNRIEKTNGDILTLKENIITLEARQSGVREMIASDNAAAEEKRVETDRIKDSLEENIYTAELENITKELADKKEELSEVTSKGEKIRDDISALFTDIQTNDSRLKLLRGYDESLQGYKYAVRKLNELTQRDEYFKKGIRGILGEVISSRPEYIAAISRALGGAVEYIVTENETVASRAIAELKKHSWGRLTFLPKNIIKAGSVNIDSSVKTMAGYIGLATELVSCDDEFRNAADSVLRGTIVTDNLENANKIAAKVNYRQKIVTLDGDVIMSGGAMVGGHSKNEDGGVLARKAEISLLEKETEDGRKVYNGLLEKRSALSEEYKALKAQVEKLEGEYSAVKEKHTSFELVHKNTLDKLSSLEAETRLIAERISLREEQIVTAQKEAEILEEKLREGEKILADLEARREELLSRDEGDEIGAIRELNKAEMAYAEASKALEYLEMSAEELAGRISDLENTLEERINAVSTAGENISRIDGQILSAEEETLALEGKKDEIGGILGKLNGSHGEISAKITSLGEKLVSLLGDRAALAEKTGNAKNTVSRYEMQIENLTQNMLESYEITYAEAKEMNGQNPLTDISQSMERAGELKEKIKRLGNINADAIEEYENERTRFEEMTLQRDDLMNSKDELMGIIDDMSENMLSKFKKEFAVIQKEFNSVFRELFGGGEAKLALTDPDDILNSGVEIIASPPGTRLKNITALSGGEKTMTAISLIFAIIRIKPSPFIVLDEIDAALDDANVVRYCSFLRSILGQNQFIIITHKKKTMENCDVLYGATMGGDGITKIVSVKLNDINEKGEPAV